MHSGREIQKFSTLRVNICLSNWWTYLSISSLLEKGIFHRAAKVERKKDKDREKKKKKGEIEDSPSVVRTVYLHVLAHVVPPFGAYFRKIDVLKNNWKCRCTYIIHITINFRLPVFKKYRCIYFIYMAVNFHAPIFK